MDLSALKNLVTLSDQIFFPPFCLNCKKGTPENPASLRWLCLECHRQMSPKWEKCRLGPEIEESFYIFDYKKDAIAKKAILALKYNWVRDLAETLNVYIEKERENIKKLEFELIIPMPLHKYRLRERGFNQSSLIAQKISEITGKEICEGVLLRKTYRKPQAEVKKRPEREKNIRNIFKVIDEDRITGKTILIVDDVATTGATLKECARVIKDSGASKIISFTLAQD